MKLVHRIIWASMREDLSSGFTTMQGLNQSAQLQRVHVARMLKFACSKFININNKGTDQTARMCRLACAFNLRVQLRKVFSRHGP